MSADVSLNLRLAITRSPAQKPPHKDLKPKWPKTSHLSLRPLMLRLLTAPVHAHKQKRPTPPRQPIEVYIKFNQRNK
ncbi:hypothetical protein FEI15_05255 [Lacticaseibacillus zeae]|uniref:Uncharacterized protein n=1 Tax=Lacticaseibacillus zeae TaxID=57037 RepID=A0A5R8LSE0_LACZE|nr:hypothetical protein FEI15_05255 [Lacticaseibacillus zeae]